MCYRSLSSFTFRKVVTTLVCVCVCVILPTGKQAVVHSRYNDQFYFLLPGFLFRLAYFVFTRNAMVKRQQIVHIWFRGVLKEFFFYTTYIHTAIISPVYLFQECSQQCLCRSFCVCVCVENCGRALFAHNFCYTTMIHCRVRLANTFA